MSIRWWTWAIWAAVAASALYWAISLLETAPPLSRPFQFADRRIDAAKGDLTRLLGVQGPQRSVDLNAPPADARFRLVGVISSRSTLDTRQGIALIAVDGGPAKLFRVGAAVEGENVLQAVHVRSVELGPRGGAAQAIVSLAPPAPMGTPSMPGIVRAPGPVPTRGDIPPTQQQLFQQRQQQQFEEEEQQNRAPTNGSDIQGRSSAP